MSTRIFVQTYWLALRRVHIDSRSRHYVLRYSLLVGLLIAYVFLLILIIVSNPWSTLVPHLVFNGFIYGAGGVAFLVLRRIRKRDEELLNFSITSIGSSASSAPHSVSVCNYANLIERAQILSTLIVRSAAELLHGLESCTDEQEGIVRQIQNSLLRRHALWSKLDTSERNLMSAPEGTWTEDQRTQIVTWSEQLRVLRWVCRIDRDLEPLAHFPKPDVRLVKNAFSVVPDRSSGPRLEPWEVRVERDVARAYAIRLLAELNHRRLIEARTETDVWASHLRDSLLGESTDLVVLTGTIADLSDEDLMLLGAVVAARERYCSYLVEQLAAADAIPFEEWWERQ